jgi:hypothetical protein
MLTLLVAAVVSPLPLTLTLPTPTPAPPPSPFIVGQLC